MRVTQGDIVAGFCFAPVSGLPWLYSLLGRKWHNRVDTDHFKELSQSSSKPPVLSFSSFTTIIAMSLIHISQGGENTSLKLFSPNSL